MAKILTKVKDFFSETDDYGDEEVIKHEDRYEEYIEEEEDDYRSTHAYNQRKDNLVSLHPTNMMKVVIVEPKDSDDSQKIADYLKADRTVIVNFEGLENPVHKNIIFNFMNGAVYVLEGTIQKVSNSIYILAPRNVDVDSSIKKELESKAVLPWQSK